MANYDYYCPLCGNKPAASFIPCRILERPICNECDDTIREFFQQAVAEQSDPPRVVENLFDYSGLPQNECKEIWQKEQMVTLLLNLRDWINCSEESGGIWETGILKELVCMLDGVVEAGSFLNDAQ